MGVFVVTMPRIKVPANRQLGTPNFDRDRFWGEEPDIKYDDILKNKAVVIERFWQIEHFRREEFMLAQNFEGRQWLNVARFHAYCIIELVKEFFANYREGSIIRRKGREKLRSWIRGMDITLTPDDFANVFQVPRIENPEFSYPCEGTPPFSTVTSEILEEGQEWGIENRKPVSTLKDKYWALHIFSCSNLLPQNRNSDCTRTRAKLIYAIGTGMTIDLPSYIWNQIAYTCEHPGALAALPFGGALTEVFRQKGAPIPDDLPIASGLQPFNITSYVKSRGAMAKKKRKIDDSEEEAEDESGPSQDPMVSEGQHAEVTNENLAGQIGALAERISIMEQNQEADHQLLQRIHQSQQTQGHLLQTVLDYLRDLHPPPPPQ